MTRPAWVVAPALFLAACGADGGAPAAPYPPAQLASPLQITGLSPYQAGCVPAGSAGVGHVGSEVEPHLAIDPVNPRHLVAAWQQDRWQRGGANGIGAATSFDGGRTWTRSDPPFTRCSTPSGAGTWGRASDPWVTILPTGVVLAVALGLDLPQEGSGTAIVASRSTDGGLTWSSPAAIDVTASPALSLDKESATADPARPGYAYVVWDRLAGLDGPATLQRGPAYLARTTDGGLTWEAPIVIHDPGDDAQTISNQVLVLPDGTLVNLLVILSAQSTSAPPARVAILRSTDAGLTWSAPITVAAFAVHGVRDPVTGHAVRSGDIVPGAAVDRRSGALYVAWQDGRFDPVADAVAFSRSTDGGLTWSEPARASGAAGVPAYTPSLAVTDTGKVGLGYYDGRSPPPGAGLWSTHWLAVSTDGGTTWTEAPDGGPFDLARAPDANGWFVGDYAGLVGGADTFTALFAMTLPWSADDPTNVFAGPPQP